MCVCVYDFFRSHDWDQFAEKRHIIKPEELNSNVETSEKGEEEEEAKTQRIDTDHKTKFLATIEQ